MKRFVDGQEVVLSEDAEVKHLSDRLLVRTDKGAFSAVAVRSGEATLISYKGRQYRVEKSASKARTALAGESGEIFAPMPGQIVDVRVSEGDAVEDGQKILVLEAMKTQQPFTSPYKGKVAKMFARAGDQVQEGQLLAVISPTEA